MKRYRLLMVIIGLIIAFGAAGAERSEAGLKLNTRGGEAWAWQKEISGSCDCGKCAEIVMKVNGRSVEVAQEEGGFRAQVLLDEGENRIRVSCRHEEGKACAAEEIVFVERLKYGPKARLKIDVSAEKDCVILSGEASAPCERTGERIAKYIWRADKSNPVQIDSGDYVELGQNRRLVMNPPKVDGEYYFSLTVEDERGRRDTARAYFVVEGGKPRAVDTIREGAAWIEESVVYGALPHMFGRPGFRAVTERLDYLKDLGINAIWLGPSTATLNGNGYAVSDYFMPRADYGTPEDFRRLIREAHKRGIRVMMDFVPNHCSIRHPYVRASYAWGEASAQYDFLDRPEAGGPPSYYHNWRDLINLNYENPEVRRWMIEAFAHWVRVYDIDGFRVDAIWGVKMRRPDFGLSLREELMRIKPELFLLAEASATDPYYFDNGFDAGYDWSNNLGWWAWEWLFYEEDEIVERLHKALTNDGRGYHEDAVVFHFMNNNDTGARFIVRHGPEMTRVVAALMCTVPGIPCVYTGQEIGADFYPYWTPGPISWEDRFGLHDYYKRLIAVRRENASLYSREWEILEVASEQQVYAYVRYGEGREAPILVVLNFSKEAATATLAAPKEMAFAMAGEFEDLLSGEDVSIASGNISLPASGVYILKRK